MPPSRIVEALDEVEDRDPCLALAAEADAIEQLALERGEEALTHCIVVAVAYRSHRRLDSGLALHLCKHVYMCQRIPFTEEVHRTVIEAARAAKYDELRRNAQTMLESVVILTSGYNRHALARIQGQGSSQARTNQLYKAAEHLGIRPVTIDNPDRYIFQDGQLQRCSPLQFEAVYLDQFAHIANVLVLDPAVPFREAKQTAVGEVEPRVFDVEFRDAQWQLLLPSKRGESSARVQPPIQAE